MMTKTCTRCGAWLTEREPDVCEMCTLQASDSDTMPCGCESGSCYCDTIDRDWQAYEESRS